MASRLAGVILLATIGAYRLVLSPLLGGTCRFTPSCSDYASQAVHEHGALYGARLALGRVCRCHPLGGWGYDPVPSREPVDR